MFRGCFAISERVYHNFTSSDCDPAPWGWSVMKVQDGMSAQVLSIGPAHTLREAARMMAARRVGAAVIVNHDDAGVGIMTERDILLSVAAGQNPDTEVAGDHCTQDLVFAARDWTMVEAAAAMVRGGFRHLVVCEGNEVVGLLSMRDIVRVWSAARIPGQGVVRDDARVTASPA
jgi:signal-transduction protein with cAMP-binding, CBS, and nucleotidyltransferase domain